MFFKFSKELKILFNITNVTYVKIYYHKIYIKALWEDNTQFLFLDFVLSGPKIFLVQYILHKMSNRDVIIILLSLIKCILAKTTNTVWGTRLICSRTRCATTNNSTKTLKGHQLLMPLSKQTTSTKLKRLIFLTHRHSVKYFKKVLKGC